jgi:hypothetical protein
MFKAGTIPPVRAAIIRPMKPPARASSGSLRSVLIALLSAAPSIAMAELECGHLMGTRQTAIRLTQAGWPFPDILQHSLDHPNYRNITRQERELVIRVVQEAYTSPPGNVSPLVLNYCQAEIERKNAAKAGAPARGDPPAATK